MQCQHNQFCRQPGKVRVGGRILCDHHYELELAALRPTSSYPVPESCRRAPRQEGRRGG